MKRKKYAWYNAETDILFTVGKKTSVTLMLLCLKHEFKFNETMLYLGEI